MAVRPFTFILLPLLVAGCGVRSPSCDDEDARILLGKTFKRTVADLMTRDYPNVASEGRSAAALITADFAGLRETGSDKDAASCSGEAVITVTLEEAVAKRLQAPAAAAYMPSELGDVKYAGRELRTTTHYTLKASAEGPVEVQADEIDEIVSVAVTYTMQVVAERAARTQ